MATIPNKIDKFADLEKDAFSTIAQASWSKVAQLLEYANKSYPIGMLMFFYGGQELIPTQPDPTYWKFLDGTPVTNPNSPVFGETLPDLRGRFFKHPGTGQPVLVEAGANTIDLTHNHGGVTGYGSDYDSLRLNDGFDVAEARGNHTHLVGPGSSGVVDIIPAYREVQVYMRIL